MYHHDGRDYKVAVGAAAKHARDQMDAMVEKARTRVISVIEEVTNKTISDSIVRAKTVKVHQSDSGSKWAAILPMANGERSVPLHDHAWQQLLSNVGMDKRYVDRLEGEKNGEEWGRDLVKHNVDTILRHRETQRNLVREEGGMVKGWLSDSFRRIDSRPLLEAFAGICKENNLLPIEGYAFDTRVRIRALIPQVFEPIPGEIMTFGLTWGNSDYGHGGHVLDFFANRMVCTNLATLESVLRQIHLGKRLSDDITYSAETYRKDQEANISALQDAVQHVIGPARINAVMAALAAKAEESIDKKDVTAMLKEFSGIGKETVEKIVAAYESPDVINLPAGESVYRLSNAVSWIAQSKEVSEDKKLELQDIAGKMLKSKDVSKALAM